MKIPKSWSEVTIKQVVNSYDIEKDTEMNEIEKMAMTVSIMTNTPMTEVDKMPLIKTREIYSQLSFLNEQPSTKFVNNFFCNGKTYFINPDVTRITNEQFQAFEYFTKDKEATTRNIHNLMAIICLEEGEQYSMATAPAKAQLLYENMTFDIVAPVSHFFFQLLKLSSENILRSLESKIDKMTEENQKLIKELEAQV